MAVVQGSVWRTRAKKTKQKKNSATNISNKFALTIKLKVFLFSLFSWAHVAKHSTLKVGGIYERFANGEVHALLRYFGTENALLPLSEQNFTRCSFFFLQNSHFWLEKRKIFLSQRKLSSAPVHLRDFGEHCDLKTSNAEHLDRAFGGSHEKRTFFARVRTMIRCHTHDIYDVDSNKTYLTFEGQLLFGLS